MRRKIAPYLAMIVLCMFAIPFLASSGTTPVPASPRKPQLVTAANQNSTPALYPANLSITSTER